MILQEEEEFAKASQTASESVSNIRTIAGLMLYLTMTRNALALVLAQITALNACRPGDFIFFISVV